MRPSRSWPIWTVALLAAPALASEPPADPCRGFHARTDPSTGEPALVRRAPRWSVAVGAGGATWTVWLQRAGLVDDVLPARSPVDVVLGDGHLALATRDAVEPAPRPSKGTSLTWWRADLPLAADVVGRLARGPVTEVRADAVDAVARPARGPLAAALRCVDARLAAVPAGVSPSGTTPSRP